MMTTFLTLLFSLIGLGILITIHEVGHLIAAKMTGMRVEAFGIGFGKALFSFTFKGIPIRISWIPFGGYVKIAGMEDLKETKASDLVPDGFFAKSPWARMWVALAGPLANLLFCLVVFTIVWLGGGRTKPFSFGTDRVGLLDPKSPLQEQQVQPGDRILSYNSQPVTSSRDHFLAAMTATGPVSIETESLLSREKRTIVCSSYSSPFFANKDMKTFGVLAPASFLVWNPVSNEKHEPFLPGDRILWVNGETIFSLQQMKDLLNRDEVYLTVRRGNTFLPIKLPRTHVSDLKLTQEVKGELTDWMFEGGLSTKKMTSLFFIPYNCNQECVVENQLEFLNAKSYDFSKEQKLLPGDVITAVWGVPVAKSFEILRLMQRPAAVVVVQRGVTQRKVASLQELDALFVQPFRFEAFASLVQNIGLEKSKESVTHPALVVLPKVPLMTKEEVLKKTPSPSEESKELYLGLMGIQDIHTSYNPSPVVAIQALFEEIRSTICALFSGSLSPKVMSGPVGIVQLLQQQWAYGIFDVLFWLGAISFNLALLNLLPLPVLDGGHILMSFLEIITFGKINSRISGKLIAPFVFLLIGLFLYLTYHDIVRLITSLRG